MFRTVLFIYLLGWASCLLASPAPIDYHKAHELFLDGKDAEAAAIYDSLIKNQGASANLYFNLANVLARSGDLGQAVLNYERGLVLNPRDAEARANLEKIRQHHNLSHTTPPLWQQPFLVLPRPVWDWLSLIFVWLAAFAFGARLLGAKKVSKKIRMSLSLIGITSSIIVIITLLGSSLCLSNQDKVVVLVPHTPLLISPFAGSSTAAVLNAGDTAQESGTHAAYLYLKSGSGKEGWVPMQNVEKILK
jgi:tetratricopeptide (TPR) repeat protein